MTYFDVFNGDADGLCALHQLRLAQPIESVLITGVKRDIQLLGRVDAKAGDMVTVLDVSLDKNVNDLQNLLEKGVDVLYFDHHYSGEIPDSEHLEVHIDTTSDVCTSLLVNDYLSGRFLGWAVVAAFGDNLHESAIRAAQPLMLTSDQLEKLSELGTYLNYNSYGVELGDLYYTPVELFKLMRPYPEPFGFISNEPAFQHLRKGYAEDMEKAAAILPQVHDETCAIYFLPDEAWARRVSGVMANSLAQDSPQRAHALLNELPGGGYQVSVRAPYATKIGADDVCRAFPTGGGRKAAAGINYLDKADLDTFITKMQLIFSA